MGRGIGRGRGLEGGGVGEQGVNCWWAAEMLQIGAGLSGRRAIFHCIDFVFHLVILVSLRPSLYPPETSLQPSLVPSLHFT